MTVKQIYNTLYEKLAPVVGRGEARSMAYIIIEDVKNYSQLDVVLYGDRELLAETEARMMSIADRVVSGEPIQYVLGKAAFIGRAFDVTPDVLIPRPETGQLVELVIKDWRDRGDIKILDIGTGSGCIAITLALDLWKAQVSAIDVSPAAIEVAKNNASNLKADVDFQLADALNMPRVYDAYDIIISNPPYVLEKEKRKMEARVLDHEPPLALFVPNDNPLMYYKAIAQFAINALRADGKLYFEINPKTADDLAQMLRDTGFGKIDILCDYRQKKRFAIASR